MVTLQAKIVTTVIFCFFVDKVFSRQLHPNCREYSLKKIAMAAMNAKTESLIGERVECIKEWEIECLRHKKLGVKSLEACMLLGEECGDSEKGMECRVRANKTMWDCSRRLVGECFCERECKGRNPLKTPNGKCVHAGSLKCACMALGKKLGYALFGGYTCVDERETPAHHQRMMDCKVPHLSSAYALQLPPVKTTDTKAPANKPNCKYWDNEYRCLGSSDDNFRQSNSLGTSYQGY